jgi:plastocyanin
MTELITHLFHLGGGDLGAADAAVDLMLFALPAVFAGLWLALRTLDVRRTRGSLRSLFKPSAAVAVALLLPLWLGPTMLAPPTSPQLTEVIIVRGAYEPDQLEGFVPPAIVVVLGVNNTIVWRNEDSVVHSAHSDIPGFDTGMFEPGTIRQVTLTRSGLYTYHCHPHPWMTGRILVTTPPQPT